MANGSTVLISKQCNLQFEILHDKNITYKANFLVLPNPTEILILGMRFLLDNDAVINLKEGSIILDRIDYQICSSSIKGNPYDDELIAKSKICTIHDDITQLIKTAKSNNPVLGSIDVAEHKIKLHSEFRPYLKEYPVPIGIRDEVQNHIKSLIENDIIEERECRGSSPAFIIKKKNGKP